MSDHPLQGAVLDRIREHDPAESQFDGETTLALERRLAREPEWVWRMLTTPEGASKWSPCVPTEALTGPGAAAFREEASQDAVEGRVSEFSAPDRLSHRWGSDELTWELSPADGYTDLRLTQVSPTAETALTNAAGWHICLATLEALADGDEADRVVGDDSLAYGFTALRDEYAAHFGVEDA